MAEPATASAATTFRPPEGLRSVVSGAGSVRDTLAEALEAQHVRRPLIVCGANVAASPLVALVEAHAGMPVAVYAGSRPHTPAASVDDGLAAARAHDADALIALGGSSASDCAKAIAVLMRSGREAASALQPLDFATMGDPMTGRFDRPMPLICIPTTLSGAEFQSFFGVRDAARKRKLPYGEEFLVRRTIFLDGEIGAATPAGIWAETGVKALDDALYRYCSASFDEPAADAVLVHAIGEIMRRLPASLTGDAGDRQAIYTAMWLTTHPMPRTRPAPHRPWFSMVARHALGGALELSHGAGSCIALAEGLRFHTEATRERQAKLAALLDLPAAPDSGAPLAGPVEALLRALGVPTRLKPLGIDRAALDAVVANMQFEAPTLGTEQQIRATCERLW